MNTLKEQSGYFYLVFAALASWLLANLIEVEDTGNRLSPPHSPNFFSSGYQKWTMSADGNPDNHLSAAHISHYSDDKTTHLQQPLLTFQQTDQPPWLIQAEAGLVSADGKEVILEGRATISREAYGNNKALKIITSNLKVKPDIHYAETADHAVLQSLPHTTSGTGMKLVFKQPIHIELLAHVQGKYETKP